MAKETIRKGYQPQNPQKLDNKNAPKGKKVTANVHPKSDSKQKTK
jgi:hypothetical protein